MAAGANRGRGGRICAIPLRRACTGERRITPDRRGRLAGPLGRRYGRAAWNSLSQARPDDRKIARTQPIRVTRACPRSGPAEGKLVRAQTAAYGRQNEPLTTADGHRTDSVALECPC